MDYKVSVIIPCYNVSPFIERCLGSILDQTCGSENLEIILIDDASTDNTLSYLERFESEHPEQTILIKLDKNSRQGAARNIGIEYSTGRYITFVDADDRIYPRMIEDMLIPMEDYDCDIVECKYDSFTDSRVIETNESFSGSVFFDLTNGEDRKNVIFRFFRTAVWGRLYRADFIRSNDLRFPENLFYEDNYFSGLCMLLTQKYYLVDEVLYSYYLNEKGTMHSEFDPEKTRQEIRVMELFLAELEKRGILAKIKNIREEFEYFCIWKSYLDPLRMMLNSGLASEDILKESKYYVRYISSVFPDASKNKYLSSEDEFVSFARDLLLMEQML